MNINNSNCGYKYNNNFEIIDTYNNIEELYEHLKDNNITLDYTNAIFEPIENIKKKIVKKSHINKITNELINIEYSYEYNKDKQHEYYKKYYENNKNKYLDKINCEYCNKLLTKNNIKRHINKKHNIITSDIIGGCNNII
jgi:hypothetical protein